MSWRKMPLIQTILRKLIDSLIYVYFDSILWYWIKGQSIKNIKLMKDGNQSLLNDNI